jgi:probable rRNA maturation factor
MNVIDIMNEQQALEVDTDLVGQWTVRILGILGRHDAELCVVLVDDGAIRELNREYLGRDRPTNVISFPQQEGDGPGGDHLGDVVISVERAAAEAADAGIQAMERLRQLLVHGICHLCGYNHEDVPEETARVMEEAEQRILTSLEKEAE